MVEINEKCMYFFFCTSEHMKFLGAILIWIILCQLKGTRGSVIAVLPAIAKKKFNACDNSDS